MQDALLAAEMSWEYKRVQRAFRISSRHLVRILVLACVVFSCLCESHAQDRRSASATLHIQVFVMPTLAAAANTPRVNGPAESNTISFDIRNQPKQLALHALRPLAPTEQQDVKTSANAVVDTLTFVAD